MRKKLITIIILLLFFSIVVSTALSFPFFNPAPKPKKAGSVFGIVIGPSSVNQPGVRYSPIQGAAVKLTGPAGTYNTVTTREGGYQFQEVKPGDYSLNVTKAGYGTYITRFSLKKAEIKRIPNISLVPGGGLSTPTGVIVPDTAYVAFSYIQKTKPKRTVRWRRGAILHGSDPFTLDGNAPFDPSRQHNPYDKGHQITSYRNSIMTIDPKDTNDINYLKLEGSPTWLKFNVSGTKLYVATEGNFVMVYDILNSSILIGSIPLPAPATDLDLSPDGRHLFITYSGTGGVMVVDTKTHKPLNNIQMPSMADGSFGIPMACAVSRDGMRVYVALSAMNSGEVVCIDAYSKQPIGRAPTGSQPVGMVMSSDGRKLFVANHNSASVSVLTTSPLSLLTNVSVGVSPTRLAASPDGQKVYVTCKGSNNVYALSSMGTQMGVISVGKEPMGIAITGDGSRLYVANHAEGTVSIIDTNSNFVLKTTRPQPHARPYGVAIKP